MSDFEKDLEKEKKTEDDPLESIDTVTLCDEDGNEYQFDLLDYVDYEDKLYTVLIPTELSDAEDDGQVVIMETFFEGNEPNFVFVEDEELAQKVLDEYAKNCAEAEEEEAKI